MAEPDDDTTAQRGVQLREVSASGPLDVVADPEALANAVKRLREGSGPIAVDAERAMGFRYFPRAYLVQLYRTGSGTVLLDPIAFDDLSSLQELLAGEECVLHAASQDLPSLREVGLDPTKLFDTELGARLAGFDRVGLAAVAERLTGIALRKEHGASDWSKRPIPAPWLEYAALDVEVLPDIRDALAAELEAQGKTDIAQQEFAFALTRRQKPTPAEPWRRLNGIHTIRDRSGLAVARSLWEAREELARELDISPGRLIPDRSIVAAVLAKPESRSKLAARRDFAGPASRSELDRWWAAIEAGRNDSDLPQMRVPSTELPPPRFWRDRNPAADVRLRLARSAIASISEAMAIPAEHVLTPDTLRRLAWDGVEPDEAAIEKALTELAARPWQISLTKGPLTDAFLEAANTPQDS